MQFVHTAGPNTALIKSSGKKTVRIVIGGRLFAIPMFQRVDRLGLELRTITVHTKRGTTINGVAVDVTSCCQVKIQGWSTAPADGMLPAGTSSPAGGDLHMDYSAIRLAAQHFIGKKANQIEEAIQQTVAGHQRAIIGVLTVEELYRDREQFSKRVLDLCYDDMRNMGLTIVSYTVAEITDDQGYIQALGVTQTESVKREAHEGKAIHENQAKSRQALEERNALCEVNKQKEMMIASDRDREIRKVEAQEEIQKKQARQEKAYEIQLAEEDEKLFAQRQRAIAADVREELNVMKEEVEKKRLQQLQDIHVPADAKLYKAKMEKKCMEELANATANKTRVEGEGEADAAAILIEKRGKATAEADAFYVEQKGISEAANMKAKGMAQVEIKLAEAKAIKAKGMAEVEVKLAEAEAIRAKGMAEVEVLRERLKIWKECGNQGVILEKIIEQLPKIAGAMAAPLSKTEKMVFVGSDGGGGPSQFTKSMNRMMAEVPETVDALTGVDLSRAISNFANTPGGVEVMRGYAEGTAEAVGRKMMGK